MMKYSIVIISKDNRRFLLNCLEKLAEEVRGRAEIVVVEAGDELTPIEIVNGRHLRLPVSEAGFSKQRNVGWKSASGEYVIFLDDDVEIRTGWFERITGGPHEDSSVDGCMGAVFPKPTGVISFITGVLGHPGGGFRLHAASLGSILPIPQVATCNTIYKKSSLEAVAGFRPELRFGSEDTDLSIRITKLHGGNRFRYLPDAVVWHYSKNYLHDLIRWYLRRGLADGALYAYNKEHRTYVLRSAISFKIIPAAICACLFSPLILPVAFMCWYVVQLVRMRFMVRYFSMYDFSVAKRVGVYFLAPIVKLIADVTLDIGRLRKLWINA